MSDQTFTNGVTLSDAGWFNDLNDATYKGIGIGGVSTVASATTPDIFAATVSGVINYTGTTTCTGFVAAPKAGARRTLVCAGAAPFTAGANVLIDGVASASNFTAAAGDKVHVIAVTTTQFRLTAAKYDGTAVVSSSITTSPPKGRITLTTAVPVTTTDVTAATTVYYTPFKGNTVPIYNGSAFVDTIFTELSQATTDATKSPAAVAASKVYDLFVWSDSGTIRCTRGPAWTNDTTPGTGAGTSQLSMVLGIMTNTVAITNGPGAGLGTYVGTIRSDASSQINDSMLLRNVANAYNNVSRPLKFLASDATHTYTTATYRAWNNATSSAVSWTACQLPFQNRVSLDGRASAVNGAAGSVDFSIGIGIDSTTVNSGYGGPWTVAGGSTPLSWPLNSHYKDYSGIGAHTATLLEQSAANGTTTWYGTNSVATKVQTALYGEMQG